MKFFRCYEYAAPLLLFPLTYWLWLRRYAGDHRLVVLVLFIPILFAYVVPGLGTNWLRLWKINSRFQIGRYRLHHGFLFGTSTSLFGIGCLDYPPYAYSTWEVVQSAFVMGSVLAFWNWIYDIYAIKVGLIKVYNHEYAAGTSPEVIAGTYCPIYFGTVGACYGASVRICEYYLIQLERLDLYWLLFVVCNAAVLTIPVLAYVAYSLATSGETGLQSYEGVNDEG